MGGALPGFPLARFQELVMDDGSRLLTGPGAGPVLSAVVRYTGEKLLNWTLKYVDANPNQSTTTTYLAKVSWPHGERTGLLGVSIRSGKLFETDWGAEVFGDDSREVAAWIYPADLDFPNLKRVTYPKLLTVLVNDTRLLPCPITGDELELKTIGYRPGRRAAVRSIMGGNIFYIKAICAKLFDNMLFRHWMLTAAEVPVPHVTHTVSNQPMILDVFQGKSLTRATFDPGDPCTPEQPVEVLNSISPSVAQLECHPPWSDAIQHYTGIVSSALPEVRGDLEWAIWQIRVGLAGIPLGIEPTYDDFHEGQARVVTERVVGILDVDTIGPGRCANDLAYLIAHLFTIQRMNPAQEAKVRGLLARWMPVLDRCVDPVELRLRTAAVVISLATGPYCSQGPNWQESTRQMVRSALAPVRQVAG